MANKSGIHIKKSHKGQFTKKAKAAGMSVQAFASHVHAHPDNYSASTRKQANFAKNAKHFKHQNGGQKPEFFDYQNPDNNPDNSNYDVIQNQNQLIQSGFNTSEQQQSVPGAGSNNYLQTPQGKAMAQRYKKMGYTATVGADGKVHYTKQQKQENPYVKDFNLAASLATTIGNKIQDNKLQQQEKLQLLQNMTPKFLPNMESQGLNNVPAYTKYGGEPTGGAPIGAIDFNPGPTSTPEMYEGIGREDSFYGGQQSIYNGMHQAGGYAMYKSGGEVSADKAKEILRDGTAQGHPLTDKQKRYFGWIAGGKKQTGGRPVEGAASKIAAITSSDNPNVNPDVYYGQNAILSYYKNQLNDKLKSKNPQAFSDYFKGLQEARKSSNPKDVDAYIENSKYNDYLSPDEVKSTLGTGYDNYLNSLKRVNSFNVAQGSRPLYGDIEGQKDINSLNFGRRFASLQVTPEYVLHQNANGAGKDYKRDYEYDPTQNAVRVKESGDLSIRPTNFGSGPVIPGSGGTKQTGGYAVGDEVDLSPAEIRKLKKQGYKIEEI